jgi:glucose/mannose transport system permease protein
MTLQRRLSRGAIYVALIAFAAYYLMPLYLMLITGLKTYDQVSIATMWALPFPLSIDGFSQAWAKVAPNFINSIIITVPAAIISAFIGSINGYVFAKWKFRGSNTIFILFLVGMFLPYQGVLIPLVRVLQAMGLYGSIVGVIFVHCIFGIPICTLMFRGYFAGIPNELIDAAKIDGCGFFSIYRWILLPISFPAFAVVLIWQFTSIWNDYLIGLIIVSNPRLAPVNVAVKNLAGTYTTQWQVQMSGALIAALPTIIVYLALGKFFMRGLLAGSLKG